MTARVIGGMRLDSVGSTSWHHRHLGPFVALRRRLLDEGPENPDVMIVGPGGVTRVLSPLLNDSARDNVAALRRHIGDLARYGDQLLRRVPFVPLVSLEPLEVSRLLPPHRLIVVDRSTRVLAAVARDLPSATVHCVDISAAPIPDTADVVIAFNVICRLLPGAQAGGMARVAAAVRPGGRLMMDDRTARTLLGAHPEFEFLGDKMYRRRT